MNTLKKLFLLLLCLCSSLVQAQSTYAEKLGYPQGKKVVIFHVDDCGMSYSSNQGAIKSIESGVATSCSIMMPCPWAASFIRHIQNSKTDYDAGLHLTLTSEWKDYRWTPLAGIDKVPGLCDKEGCMWHSVEQVVTNASADEVEMEIRAQLKRAQNMGLQPTHMDSHMGTLFASPAFLERYIKVGIEHQIPVMFPGGNNKLLIESLNNPIIKKLKQEGKWTRETVLPTPEIVKQAGPTGQMIWAAGLPVLDDLHTISGDWAPQGKTTPSKWGKYKAKQFMDVMDRMEPGVAMLIVHSSDITDTFQHISGSGGSRQADMLSMMDKELKKYIEKNGIILTTFRELMERRQKVK
jgi:predicted glycoside hydrolase/deacetylase ChbG (UPF0249 family)